jgi:DNA polymerase-4
MILHVDMDAFFASIEQRDNPALRGKPVIVGGSKTGRGVVATASYEARKYGVHSAMSGYRAAQLCPDAVFVKSNHQLYSKVGRQVRDILHRFTPVVQPLSCDEAFLDISGTMQHFGTPEEVAHQIKQTIRDELKLTASVGAAPRKFIAKIASDFRKPDGCVVVTSENMQAFIDPLPIGRLWGVGKVAQRKLHLFGVHTIQDMRQLSPESVSLLGSWGLHLYQLANCIDPGEVITDRRAKQISHERTFGEDITDLETLLSVGNYLTDQVCRRMRGSDRRGKGVSIKYRTSDFSTYNLSRYFQCSSDHIEYFWPVVSELLEACFSKHRQSVRLIGVSVFGLTEPGIPRQLGLFDQEAERVLQKLELATDIIVKKLGSKSVYRGTAHQYVSTRYTDNSNSRNLPDQ